jgi:hypothetical protein
MTVWDSVVVGIALATVWMARGSDPGGGGDFLHLYWGPFSLLYNGYRGIPGGIAAGMWR